MSSPHGNTPTGPQRDDPSAAPTAYVTAILAVALVITVLGLAAYYGRVESEEQQAKLVAPEVKALADLKAEQAAKLAGYHWVAADSGLVRVPIDRAMELVAAEMAIARPLPSPSASAGK